MQRGHRRGTGLGRGCSPDVAGHAVGSGNLEQFIEQCADLLFVGPALEERHRLALQHRHRGGHGLDLERLGELGEDVDVDCAEHQPAGVTLHHPFQCVEHPRRFRRVRRPEREHHRHLRRQLDEVLEIGLGDLHTEGGGLGSCRRIRRTRRRHGAGHGTGLPCAGRASCRRSGRRLALLQGGKVDGAAEVELAGGGWRDRSGSWRTHSLHSSHSRCRRRSR